jgi:hypothetical protein
MTNQHRATPEQWANLEACTRTYPGQWGDCVLELRARIEALEAAQQDKLDRLIALDREDPTPDAAMPKLRAWCPLNIETTYGSEAAADAAQILRAPMVVEGTFEHGGETYRFKTKPERESAMTELRAASAEAQPAGGLVERVAEAMQPGTFDWSAYEAEARAAIREVAAAAKERIAPFNPWLRWNDVAQWLEQEANQ